MLGRHGATHAIWQVRLYWSVRDSSRRLAALDSCLDAAALEATLI